METTQLNLRRSTDPAEQGSLTPIGAPAVISPRPWRGIGFFPDGNGYVTEFTRDGLTLGAAYYPVSERPPEPRVVGELTFVAEGVVNMSEGFLIVGPDDNLALVRPDETGTYCLAAVTGDYPECRFEQVSRRFLPASIDAVKLKNAYDAHSTVLSRADAASVSSVLAGVYANLAAGAVAASLFVQPVLLRYSLYDAAGNVLFRSGPRLMPADAIDDFNAAVNLEIDSSGSATLPSSMQLGGYSVSLRIPAVAPGCDFYTRAARLVVEATPQLHRPDFSLPMSTRLSAPVGQNIKVAGSLPGCDAPIDHYRRLVADAVAAADDLFTPVLTVNAPFDAGCDERLVEVPPARLSVRDELAALAAACKVARKPATPVDNAVTRCSLPHRSMGAVSAVTGSHVLLANPVTRLFRGHSLDYYGNMTTAIDNIETVAIVTFVDGYSRVVCHNQRHGSIPGSVSPFFSYPDPSACRVDMYTMTSGGKTLTASLPLTPMGSGACYLSPDLAPVALKEAPEGVEFNIPAPVGNVVSYPGLLLSGGAAFPFAPEASSVLPGRVVAIKPAPRVASYSISSASTRFIASGTAGIFSFGVDTAGRFSRPVALDSRPVLSGKAVAAVTARNEVTKLMLLAGGDLVEISSGSVRTLREAVAGRDGMLLWRDGELLIIEPGRDTCLVYTPSAPGQSRFTSRSMPATVDVAGDGPVARATSATAGYLDLNHEVEGNVRCRLEVTAPVSGYIDRVVADIASPEAHGTIDIAMSEGAHEHVNYARLTYDGRLYSPIVYRPLVPKLKSARLVIDGTFRTGSYFRNITIY